MRLDHLLSKDYLFLKGLVGGCFHCFGGAASGLFLSFLDCFYKNKALFGHYRIYSGLAGCLLVGLGACCRVYG